jgi:hypothetical protein
MEALIGFVAAIVAKKKNSKVLTSNLGIQCLVDVCVELLFK